MDIHDLKIASVDLAIRFMPPGSPTSELIDRAREVYAFLVNERQAHELQASTQQKDQAPARE